MNDYVERLCTAFGELRLLAWLLALLETTRASDLALRLLLFLPLRIVCTIACAVDKRRGALFRRAVAVAKSRAAFTTDLVLDFCAVVAAARCVHDMASGEGRYVGKRPCSLMKEEESQAAFETALYCLALLAHAIAHHGATNVLAVGACERRRARWRVNAWARAIVVWELLGRRSRMAFAVAALDAYANGFVRLAERAPTLDLALPRVIAYSLLVATAARNLRVVSSGSCEAEGAAGAAALVAVAYGARLTSVTLQCAWRGCAAWVRHGRALWRWGSAAGRSAARAYAA